MRQYANNIAVSLSITANTVFGGKRYEMLSSRAYRCEWWLVVAMIDTLFELVFDDLDHCLDCHDKQHDEGIYDI